MLDLLGFRDCNSIPSKNEAENSIKGFSFQLMPDFLHAVNKTDELYCRTVCKNDICKKPYLSQNSNVKQYLSHLTMLFLILDLLIKDIF